jgi:hypothetical protein
MSVGDFIWHLCVEYSSLLVQKTDSAMKVAELANLAKSNAHMRRANVWYNRLMFVVGDLPVKR